MVPLPQGTPRAPSATVPWRNPPRGALQHHLNKHSISALSPRCHYLPPLNLGVLG